MASTAEEEVSSRALREAGPESSALNAKPQDAASPLSEFAKLEDPDAKNHSSGVEDAAPPLDKTEVDVDFGSEGVAEGADTEFSAGQSLVRAPMMEEERHGEGEEGGSQYLNGNQAPDQSHVDKAQERPQPPSSESALSTEALGQTLPELPAVSAQQSLDVSAQANEDQDVHMASPKDAAEDPFRFLGEASRSNSFPDVKPGQSSGEQRQNSTQLDMASMSVFDASQTLNEGQDDPLPHDGRSQIPDAFGIMGADGQMEEASFFDRQMDDRADEPTLTDAEVRYEEGFPLISSGDAPNEPKQVPDDAVGEVSIPSGNGFEELSNTATSKFSLPEHTEDPDPELDIQPLQRKSTAQVLGLLDMPPSKEENDDLGFSKLSIAEDPAEASNGVTPSGDGTTEDPSLAAMWQAALGDDDLLDDTNEVSDSATWFPEETKWEGTDNAWDISGVPEKQSSAQFPAIEAEQRDAQNVGTGILNMMTSPGMPAAGFGQPSYPSSQPSYAATQAPGSRDLGHGDGFGSGRGGSMSRGQSFQNYSTSWNMQPQQALQRPDLSKAQSYADKSKGGYSSPYDLPADITKPRKRGGIQHVAPGRYGHAPPAMPPPPPRSTSVYAPQSSGTFPDPNGQPLAPSSGFAVSASVAQPPHASHPQLGRNATMPTGQVTRSSTNITNFFEDLPVTAGPKRPHQAGKVPSRTGGGFGSTSPPLVPHPMGPPPTQSQSVFPGASQPALSHSPLVAAEQLRPPERMDPFAAPDQPSPGPRPAASNTSRYSPAPPAQTSARGRGKYAPIPGGTGPVAIPHQPRTSSPLASRSSRVQEQPSSAPGPPAFSDHPVHYEHRREVTDDGPMSTHPPMSEGLGSTSRYTGGHHRHSSSQESYGFPPVTSFQPPAAVGPDTHYLPTDTSGVSGSPGFPPSVPQYSSMKPLPNAYPSPALQHGPPPDVIASPPRRSQTQSPGTAFSGPPHAAIQPVPYARPASVDVPTSEGSMKNPYPAMAAMAASKRPRALSQPRDYIAPTDGREYDPLSRWRGCPIVTWGFGGTIVTSFPKEVPRYSPGQRYPSLKCSPGEVRTRAVKDILPLEDHIAAFPGPLRGKVKKKDVITWLTSRIGQLDAQMRNHGQLMNPAEATRVDERMMLLKVLGILVENDGLLAGSPKVEKAVRDVLSFHQPQLSADPQTTSALTTLGNQLPGSRPGTATLDPAAVDTIKKLLLSGEKEKAVWHAVDNRMWAHAMLISSAVTPAIWKQVVREFVRNDVRQVSQDTESLAAVYQIFAGNIEEFIDELVPSSARAGLQLISKSSELAPSKSGLEGLDKWIETLTLVLSNRSAEDVWALKQLGQLLLFYGRVEAAHICLVFAHAPFGGADDPQTAMALLGLNHLQEPPHGDIMDSVLLSEVYEFGLSLANSSTAFSAPHLQAYKFYHALLLAQHGHLHEAQLYCESIAQVMKSTAKTPSQYLRALAPAVEDLSKRLQRSLKNESSSWISKPSMEKVSDSLFAKFNSFVAGNEADRGKNSSGDDGVNGEVGPFARIAGNTPIISRPSSQNDFHPRSIPQEGPLSNMMQRSNSGLSTRPARYTPISSYTPQPSMNQGQSSLAKPAHWDLDSSLHPGSHLPLPPNPSNSTGIQQNRLAISEPSLKYRPADSSGSDTFQSQEGASTFNPYGYVPDEMPVGSVRRDGSGQDAGSSLGSSLEQSSNLQGGHVPVTSGYQPLSYEPPSTSYEPPSANAQSYEPPSSTFHDSANQNGSASFGDKAAKRSNFMDDDDDEMTSRAAQLSKQEKERKDKEAEENFRKAAEADAKRGQQQGEKKGWLTGWFAKKEQAPGTGPVKAKLGEQSSFYYDTELKKWVNKKGGTPQPSSAGTPPPPKGPPTRAVSGPAAGPPSRSISTSAPPPASAGTPPLPNANFTGPSSANIPQSSRFAPPPTVQALSSGGNTPARGPSPALGVASNANSGSSALPAGPNSQPPAPGPAAAPAPAQPPTRPAPATAASNASSIDDLLGPAGTIRKGGTMKKAKKGRGYVDVMAGAAGAGSSGGSGRAVSGGGLPS